MDPDSDELRALGPLIPKARLLRNPQYAYLIR
jgi:hypothetical protein